MSQDLSAVTEAVALPISEPFRREIAAMSAIIKGPNDNQTASSDEFVPIDHILILLHFSPDVTFHPSVLFEFLIRDFGVACIERQHLQHRAMFRKPCCCQLSLLLYVPAHHSLALFQNCMGF